MKQKRVWRYYCEFCGKANCSKPSIAKHERGCTLNPQRVCGVCGLMGNEQPKLEAMFAALPKRSLYAEADEEGMGFFHPFTPEELDTLKKAAGNCPACMMAAMRQRKLPVALLHEAGFDYQKEIDAAWNEFWTEKNDLETEGLC